MRNGRPVRSFSAGEDALITQARIDGVPIARIVDLLAERLGTARSGHTVRVRLKMLANRDEA